jgi:hypothetical protein
MNHYTHSSFCTYMLDAVGTTQDLDVVVLRCCTVNFGTGGGSSRGGKVRRGRKRRIPKVMNEFHADIYQLKSCTTNMQSLVYLKLYGCMNINISRMRYPISVLCLIEQWQDPLLRASKTGGSVRYRLLLLSHTISSHATSPGRTGWEIRDRTQPGRKTIQSDGQKIKLVKKTGISSLQRRDPDLFLAERNGSRAD